VRRRGAQQYCPCGVNRFVIILYPSADAWNKLWSGGLKDHQEKVGNKYADFRILNVESVEMK